MNNKKILAIGNSHVSVFTGVGPQEQGVFKHEQFETYAIGPIIAYNMYEHHLDKIKEHLSGKSCDDYIVMPVVGEVDCRWHLPKVIAENPEKPFNDIVEECVIRYMRVHIAIQQLGYEVLTWCCHPSTTDEHRECNSRPVYGTVQYRNTISKAFNNYLIKFSKYFNIKYINIYPYLVDDNNITKMEYYMDYCHLDHKLVYPIILQELENV